MDQEWLLAINGWHAAWADTVMWAVSGKGTWIPLYVLLLYLVVRRFRRPGAKWGGWQLWVIVACFALTVVGCDQISSIIKHAVCRFRPTHEPALEGMVHIVHGYTGGQYGFVSSHAANTMGVALLFCLLFHTTDTQKSHHCWWLMGWVALNCYSRMYLGVHYPGDIVGGLIIGSGIAIGIFAILYGTGVCRVSSSKTDTSSIDQASESPESPCAEHPNTDTVRKKKTPNHADTANISEKFDITSPPLPYPESSAP